MRNRATLNQVTALKQNLTDLDIPDGFVFTLAVDPKKFFDPYTVEAVRACNFKCKRVGSAKDGVKEFLQLEDWDGYDLYLQRLREQNQLHPANTLALIEVPILSAGVEVMNTFIDKHFSSSYE